MNLNVLFSILVAFMFIVNEPLSAQDCVGVHITQQWNCADATATATAHPEGGTAPYTYNWSNGDTGPTATDLAPGQHYVTVTDAIGCLHVEACIVVVPECCIWFSVASTPDDCKPANSGQITIWEIGGGVPPYTISISNGMTKVSNGNAPIFINNLPSGTYYVTVTDATCSNEQMIEVEQEKSPIVNLFSNGLTCTATTTDITTQVTNGPVTFLWNTGATTNSLMNVGPGTYTVKVTNPSGCSDSDTIEITAPQQVTLDATATPTACGENNGMINVSTTASNVTVVAPNGAIYNLNGSATITNLQPGVYEITATNSNGCSMVETAIVDDSQAAKDSVSCVTICQPGFVNGVWVSSNTTLTDTLINANGCEFLFKLMVNLQTIDTTHQTAFTCFGGVITVNGVEYKKDTTVYAQTNGNCPGLTIWDLQFSDEPDTLLMPAVKVCGGDSASVYTFENTIGINTDCAELVVIRTFEHQPYTLEFVMNSNDTICGLANRTDSLFQKISVDNQNCVITQPYGLLVTNTPKVDTIPGPTHYICGTPASTIWVETGDTMNIEKCNRKIEGYWQITGPKPPMVILYQDTCYNGPLPIAPVQILHSDCNPDTLIIPIPYTSVINPISKNLCQGDTLHLGNMTITEAGDYEVFAGQTIHGCDSTDMVHVTMIFGSKFETTQDTCNKAVAGEKFWKVTTSLNGCVDSTLVTLQWVPGFEKDSTFFTCRKQDAFCHSDTVQENGCWGIVHYGADYFPETFSEVAYACDSLQAGYTVKAWIPANPNDPTDCDSIVWLHKILRTIQPTQLNPVVLCPGENVLFEGQNYPAPSAGESVTLTKTYMTLEGCDSVVTQVVTGLPQSKREVLFNVCPDGEVYFAEADTILTVGTYVFEFPVFGGCNEIVTVSVTEYTANLFAFVPQDTTIVMPIGVTPAQADGIAQALVTTSWFGSLEDTTWTIVRHELFGPMIENDTTNKYLEAWAFKGPCGQLDTSRFIYIVFPKPIVTPPDTFCPVEIVTIFGTNVTTVKIREDATDGKTIKSVYAIVIPFEGGNSVYEEKFYPNTETFNFDFDLSNSSILPGMYLLDMEVTLTDGKKESKHYLRNIGGKTPVTRKILKV